jgi:hypothetical protein
MISFKAAGSTLLMIITLWLISREPNKKVQIHVILIRKLIAKMAVMPFFGDFALV